MVSMENKKKQVSSHTAPTPLKFNYSLNLDLSAH